ncbi:MAG: type II/IV secretion system protein [Magnetococcales bacterium]|nr:type II/IV secretion system protein [Magnetococcales bacterium]
MLGAQKKKLRLGDLLVAQKLLTDQQLQVALSEQKRNGGKLGNTVVSLGYISEVEMLRFLSRQLRLPFVDLRTVQIKEEVIQLLSEDAARTHQAAPLAKGKEGYLVGMVDPTDLFAYDELVRLLKAPVRLAIVNESDLIKLLDRVYRKTEEIQGLAEELGQEMSRSAFDLNQFVKEESLTNAPVVRILQSLFEDAVQMGASDIHIEPDDEVLRIRQRLDGQLSEQVFREKQIAPALISKLKLMAGLEISEKRLPQDGRFHMTVKDRSIDIRISTLPIQSGESVVMRLLDQRSSQRRIEQIGFPIDIETRFKRMISQPNGIVLVTGPTGSGKTTTLYSALNALNQPERKIITAEDPVEYRLPRVNQVQIRPQIGLTFASVLRTILRQDPDIVLVGEMRDQETANIAIRAALTGHLVLSTLHTNDAPSTAIRLIDMGVEGYAVASALTGVLAQRLVRRLCTDCRIRYQPSELELSWLRGVAGPESVDWTFYHGEGCSSCHKTGFSGRRAVVELLEIRGALADALRQENVEAFFKEAQKSKSFRPLHMAALDLARQGETTLEEAMKLHSGLGEFEDEEEALDQPDQETEVATA